MTMQVVILPSRARRSSARGDGEGLKQRPVAFLNTPRSFRTGERFKTGAKYSRKPRAAD
jgi:hypothetical protein